MQRRALHLARTTHGLFAALVLAGCTDDATDPTAATAPGDTTTAGTNVGTGTAGPGTDPTGGPTTDPTGGPTSGPTSATSGPATTTTAGVTTDATTGEPATTGATDGSTTDGLCPEGTSRGA